MAAIQRPSGERGAISTIVVTLLAAGVLLGFVALSVDLGQTVLERRELQNGADAGALSVAQSYAAGDPVNQAALQALVNGNASDGEHTIARVCGTPQGLPDCVDFSVEDIKLCPPLPTSLSGVSYVEVHTSTLSGGVPFLENLFGAAAGGDATSEVEACARAGWGRPGSGTTIPIAFSLCEYLHAIDPDLGGGYGIEVALATKYKNNGNPCPEVGHSGMDAPGGFGWLTPDPEGPCKVTLDENKWASGDTGEDGLPCLTVNTTVLLPIFDCVSNNKNLDPCDNVANGSHTNYHIDGFAAFHVTAWKNIPSVGSSVENPGDDAKAECQSESQNGQRCLYGYFLEDYVDLSGTIGAGGSDYGVTVVQPLG